MDIGFWKDKRVFLTGHTGFKGTWMSFWLDKLGAKVTGYALDPVSGACYDYFDWRNMRDIRGDIRNSDRLARAVRESESEIVFHLASQTFIAPSLADPRGTYETNVMGLVNLLEAVRQTKSIRCAVIVTSDKTYFGDSPASGFSEDQTLLGALEPYSASKGCQELITGSYRSAFLKDKMIATARASNVIGGGDPFRDRLIPAMLDAFGRGDPVQLRNPLAVRPWQNVLDCLRGYMMLAQKLYENGMSYSGAWNFGPLPDGMRTVKWIAQRMKEYWGGDASYEVTALEVAMPEKDILRLDITKSISQLGWKPLYTLERTLQQVVAFEKGRLNGISARELFEDALKEKV